MSEHTHEYDEDGGSCRICGMTVSESLRSLAPATGSADEIARLRAAMRRIAETAEEYNYIGWQRIVGVMRKIAEDALREPNTQAEARRERDP